MGKKAINVQDIKTCFQRLVEDMRKCQTPADLHRLVKKHKLKGKDITQYPPLHFTISKAEIEGLEKEGWLTQQSEKNYALDVNKFTSATPLEKLLLALIWKNGDLAKIRHIIRGIKGEEVDNGRLVFHALGLHISAPEEHPIIDQHVIRAYRIITLLSGASEGWEERIKEACSSKVLTQKDEEDVAKYKKWLRENTIVSGAVRGADDYLRNMDDLLFAMGRYAASGSLNDAIEG